MLLRTQAMLAFMAGAFVVGAGFAAVALPSPTLASIDNFTFKPGTITVKAGTRVLWENNDDIPHTVVALDGAFRSQALDTEDKFEFMFSTAGTFDYFCSLHPQMTGKVVVTK